jgi:hypothetical protein
MTSQHHYINFMLINLRAIIMQLPRQIVFVNDQCPVIMSFSLLFGTAPSLVLSCVRVPRTGIIYSVHVYLSHPIPGNAREKINLVHKNNCDQDNRNRL